MEWILFVGAVIYYLYKAYQQEAQKNVNKPLTPVNKPLRKGQKQVITPAKQVATPQREAPKTLEEVWQELREAANQREAVPETIDQVPEIQPEKKITSIEYDTMFGREEKELASIEYQDALFRTGEAIDKVPSEEGSFTIKPFKSMVEYDEKVALAKYFKVRGKKISPKDAFIASLILEKKV